jgi:hypothetical protein
MIEMLGVPSASSYANDIDLVFEVIFWIVGAWFLLAEGVFFYLIFRFRKKEGVRGQYITGELKSEKRWITIPHNFILLFDVIILVFAVKIWYDVKQDLPDAPDKRVVRVIAQQWAWTFVDPGADGKLDTPDDIAKVNEMHVVVDKLHHFQLESKDVLHSFSGVPPEAGRDPGPRHHRLVHPDHDRQLRDPVCGDLRRRPRADARADHHRDCRSARGVGGGELERHRRVGDALGRGGERRWRLRPFPTNPMVATVTSKKASSSTTSSRPTTRSSPCSTCSPAWRWR